MSRRAVELLLEGYAAYNARDIDAALQTIAPDCVWDLTNREMNPGVYHGHEGMRQLWRETAEVWDTLAFEVVDVIDEGDHLVAEIRARGRGRGSGVEVEDTWFDVWEIRGDVGVHMRQRRDRGAALALARGG